MSEYFLSIANIKVKIVGNNQISKLVADDLNSKRIENEKKFDIVLNINCHIPQNYIPSIYSAKNQMNFNENEYYVGYLDGINYHVRNLFNEGTIEVFIQTRKKNIKSLLKKIYSLNTFNVSKDMVLSYSLFWYIFNISLLKKNMSFIHAGVFSNSSDEATVITGTGGCGKTSTLFKLLEDNNRKYISEDFGIIDNESFTYYNPKPISIYASDMEFGQDLLQNCYHHFSISDKLIWNFARCILNRNPKIKALPRRVMKHRIKKISKIKTVLFLVRSNNNILDVKDIRIEELCDRILDASMRELKTFTELLMLLRANAPLEYNIPSYHDIRAKTKTIYKTAFRNTTNRIIYIPHKTKPDELVGFLKETCLI